jgi:hypothetical protein
MLERRNEIRRQMNSMTMLYNTDLSLSGVCSAEAIAFLAPVWCSALEGTVSSTLGSMTRGG